MASLPLASSCATYDDAGSAFLRESMVRASRARTEKSIIGVSTNLALTAVDLGRLFEHRIGQNPPPILKPPEKTTLASGMAGNAACLIHTQEHSVRIAVDTQLLHPLYVAGLLSLAPKALPRSGPVVR